MAPEPARGELLSSPEGAGTRVRGQKIPRTYS